MEADIIITIALTIMIMIMFGLFQLARIIRTFAVQRTLREALLRGSTLTPELLAGMEEPQRRAASDDRTGLVLIAIALALIGFGVQTTAKITSGQWRVSRCSRCSSGSPCSAATGSRAAMEAMPDRGRNPRACGKGGGG